MKTITIISGVILLSILSCSENSNKISADFVVNRLTCYPEDSISLEFSISIEAEKEPYLVQWINPDTLNGTGSHVLHIEEDLLLDVLILDSEKQEYRFSHEILKDTIDPLKYDYRTKYCGYYVGEKYMYNEFRYDPPYDTIVIDTAEISKHEEFTKLYLDNSTIDFYFKTDFFELDKGSGSFYSEDSIRFRYYSGPDGSVPVYGNFRGKRTE